MNFRVYVLYARKLQIKALLLIWSYFVVAKPPRLFFFFRLAVPILRIRSSFLVPRLLMNKIMIKGEQVSGALKAAERIALMIADEII